MMRIINKKFSILFVVIFILIVFILFQVGYGFDFGKFFLFPKILFSFNYTTIIDNSYFGIYDNLTKAVNEIENLCRNAPNVKLCVERNKRNIFFKYGFDAVSLETNKEKAFYNFVDVYEQCEQTKDNSCRCYFDTSLRKELYVYLFSKGSLSYDLKNDFSSLNVPYYYAFFSYDKIKPFLFTHNLDETGIKEVKLCSINDLVDNALMLNSNMKYYDGLRIDLNNFKIESFRKSKDFPSTFSLENLNYSLIKTKDNYVCFVDNIIDEKIVQYYFFMYAYTFSIKSMSPLSLVDPTKVDKVVSDSANRLMEFYNKNSGKFSVFRLDFCDFLRYQNFDNFDELFPECKESFLSDGSLNPKIIQHSNYVLFKNDLLKLKKKECNLEKHYFKFEVKSRKRIFNYFRFRFEKPTFKVAVYI